MWLGSVPCRAAFGFKMAGLGGAYLVLEGSVWLRRAP